MIYRNIAISSSLLVIKISGDITNIFSSLFEMIIFPNSRFVSIVNDLPGLALPNVISGSYLFIGMGGVPICPGL